MLATMSSHQPPLSTPAIAAPAQERSVHARQLLLEHATRIFASKGFSGASTREICRAAGVNLAAIRYYFGGKENLFRAALTEPIHLIASQLGRFDDPALPFAQSIRQVLAPLLGMTQQDDYEQQVTRLHLRETLEPSAVFREVVVAEILPLHNALARLLARHCGLAEADTDIHQLTFAMIALAHDYCISREYMRLISPAVLNRPDAEALILERLVGYCTAMLDHERQRRNLTPSRRHEEP